MPQLRHSFWNELGDRARIVSAAVDFYQGPQAAARERAACELVGVARGGESGLDADASLQCGADDPGPAQLGEIDRNEVGRRAPELDRGGARERVVIDCLGR